MPSANEVFDFQPIFFVIFEHNNFLETPLGFVLSQIIFPSYLVNFAISLLSFLMEISSPNLH